MEPLEERIFKTLDKLENFELEMFKFHLRHPDVLEGLDPIPKRPLKKAGKRTIARLMVCSYPSDAAQKIVVNVLNKIHRNDLVERFPHIYKNDQHEASNTDPPMQAATSTTDVSKVEDDQHEASNTDPPMQAATSTTDVSKVEDLHEATTPTSTSTGVSKTADKHFVDKHWSNLIQRVTMVNAILDLLRNEGVITNENYSNVRSKTTNQEKMRELLLLLTTTRAKEKFYKGLEEHEKALLDDLNPQPSKGESAPGSGLLVKPSGRPITYYEDLLQRKMDKTYLGVTLGTEPEVMFKDIFIALYNAGINVTDIHSNHEVRQLEMNKAGEEKEIQIGQIFKDPSGRNRRTVLTVGCAGIGKTFLLHKFLFDWAKKCFPQDPHLVFPLKFRQLNLLKGQSFSLAQLIRKCIKETRFIEEDVLNYILNELQNSEDYDDSPFKVMFVMDGYDENYMCLNFIEDLGEMHISQSYPVEILIVNLIKGELLPSAQLWITSRPAAAHQITEYVNGLTEVRGFIRDDQKKEFFMKTFKDENQASSIYSHIKETSILHTMCEIPVFCWILATVVKNMGMRDELPKTLVELYCYFVMGETQREKMKNPAVDKAAKEKIMKDAGELLLKLGRLALSQLEKGNIMFYQKDLEECGLDVNDTSLYSGFCTTFFRKDDVFFLQTVYCFVHLSIQEFMAAVFLFHCFTQNKMDVLKTFLGGSMDGSMSDFLRAAMDKNLRSESGNLDLFTRFLHGLSLESNQRLLGGLLGPSVNCKWEVEKIIHNLKEKNTIRASPDRCINIFHCLMEMNDPSVSQGIQQYLESQSRSGVKLSVPQCSALASMLQMSEKCLEVFDLDRYNADKMGRWRLIPLVRNCTTARLVGCELKEEHIKVVASALSSTPSHLRELDLSEKVLKVPALELLCAALKSPHCCLQVLRLVGCGFEEEHIKVVASALSSTPSHLRELDLSGNVLGVSGLELLCAALKSPHCCLQVLRLKSCGLSERCCEVLVSALTSNPSLPLRELDISLNMMNEGIQMLLSAGQNNLQVTHGGEDWLNAHLIEGCFHRLTLHTNTAHKDLSLSQNNRKVTRTEKSQDPPDHPDRFDYWEQVLCTEGLTGRCYWEVELSGEVRIAVTYEGIGRKQMDDGAPRLGDNDKSWGLCCTSNSYSVSLNGKGVDLRPHHSNRVAVYLDWTAGTLSFYEVLEDTLSHLYTFQNTFTEPLYAGFCLGYPSSVCLCEQR